MMNTKCTALGSVDWKVNVGVALVIALALCDFAETAARAALDKDLLFVERGDYGTVIKCFTDALKLNPNDAQACYERGVAYGIKKRAASAAPLPLISNRYGRERNGLARFILVSTKNGLTRF